MEMPMVIVGGQWGDEGKGKVVNLLSSGADLVARCQGGHNAGHTVIISGSRFALHLLPSGILAAGKVCVIGNGIVIDPEALLKEIEGLREARVDVNSLRISDRAHLLLPQHVLIDQLREQRRRKGKIGTTGRGIGPCYESKYTREGIRAGFLQDPERMKEKLFTLCEAKNRFLEEVYGNPGIPPREVYDRFMAASKVLAPLITDTGLLIHTTLKEGKRILVEGAQGTLLDIDHGTFPFVTSSNATVGGACTGLGLPPTCIRSVVGVLKAYCTRVGHGPFTTELEDDAGKAMGERGKEFGTTTGRPRRCGWFDAVAGRYAVRINGLTGIALTKLDVLDVFEEIKICTAYRHEGRSYTEFPSQPWILDEAEPVYEAVPGWGKEILGITEWEDLPEPARAYVEYLERILECPIPIVSTGPDRKHTIIRDPSLKALLGV